MPLMISGSLWTTLNMRRLYAPPIPLQIHPPLRIELGSLRLEQHSLQLVRITAGARADLAFRVHDAMPRHVAFFGKVVERVADLAGVTFEAGDLGDLSVRRDASARDFAYDGPDELVAFHGRRIVRCTGFSAQESRV